jgi:hypothetical protein
MNKIKNTKQNGPEGWSEEEEDAPTATQFIRRLRDYLGVTFEEDVVYIYAVSRLVREYDVKYYAATWAAVVFSRQRLRKSVEKAFSSYELSTIKQTAALSFVLSKAGVVPEDCLCDGPHVFGHRPTEERSRER